MHKKKRLSQLRCMSLVQSLPSLPALSLSMAETDNLAACALSAPIADSLLLSRYPFSHVDPPELDFLIILAARCTSAFAATG